MNLGREFAPDLILLDVMLPDGSGFDVFETLHQGGRIPVIFLPRVARRQTGFAACGSGTRRLRDQAVLDLAELLARVHAGAAARAAPWTG